MTQELGWTKLTHLFEAALEMLPEERNAFLEQTCAGNAELRRELQSLFDADVEAGHFMEIFGEQKTPILGSALPSEDGATRRSIEAPEEPLKPGSPLGRYVVRERLGAGGMGVVYEAYDPELNRKIAIKLMRPGASGSTSASEGRARLMREAQAMAQLSHPNVIAVHDVGTFGDQVFIAMEHVEGRTLTHWLAEQRRPWREIVNMFVHTGRGLAAAHVAGILHRDFKPDNVLVGKDGRPRVLDFGLARALFGEPEKRASDDESAKADANAPSNLAPLKVVLTQPGRLMGTPAYMAPEQLMGERVDEKADQYSFCAALFQGLYGVVPFNGDDFDALLEQIRLRKVNEVPKSNSVPSSVRRTLLRGLSPNPADRFSSMEALLEKLERQRAVLPALVMAVLVMGALVVGAPFYFRRAQELTETDYILLPEFVNTTGEPVFDGTLKQALAVKLQESPFLNVVSEERIGQTLRLMGRAPDERVTPSLAREICQRQGVKAMLSGQIAPLGSHYVIALNAVNCQSGDSLAREQVEAARKEEVLRVLGKAASDLRRKLGESLSSIRKFDVPVEQATTSSLEALKSYTLAARERALGTEVQAIPFFRRAIELDPNFAMAYGMLGVVYSNCGQPELGVEYIKKAFELRERVSEPERLYLISHYHGYVTGDFEKGNETGRLWKQIYPRDWIPWSNLAMGYTHMGMYDKAIGEAQEALRLAPNQAYNYMILAWAYFGLNRFDEAKAISEEGISKGIEAPGVRPLLYCIAAIRGDAAGMQHQVEWTKGTPNEGHMLASQADAATYFGKLQRARHLNQQSAAVTQRRNLKESAGETLASEALTEAELGNPRLARERAAEALALAPRGFSAQMFAGEALATSGQSDQALALAADVSKRFPHNTLLNAVAVPLIRATVEVERGNSQAAIELLESAEPYEYGEGFLSLYIRGKAHLRAGAGREAVAEFQKVLDHRGAAWASLWPVVYPLAQLGLARAHTLAGDLDQSRRAYQDFFALWKDADPDIPILQQAKAEYAKLNRPGVPARFAG